MKNQNGFTLPELLAFLLGMFIIAGVGFLVYALIHFLLKFW